MKTHVYRTILIYVAIIATVIEIYPTMGWMMLSPERREARLAMWKAEDAVFQKPSFSHDAGKAIRRWTQFDRSKVINLGLDLQGGVHMVVGFDLTDELKERGFDNKSTQQMVLQTIRRRIHEFAVQEPIIQGLGDSQIQIQLPGVKDPERATELIMRAAHMTFHMVSGRDETASVFKAVKEKFPDRFTPFLERPDARSGFFRVPEEHIGKVREVVKEATDMGGVIPENKTIAFSQPPNQWDEYKGYYIYVMDKEPAMSGMGLKQAQARPDDESPGNWRILFEFRGDAARQFGEVTGANVDRSMAIVLDGVVCSAPTIRSKITSVGTITGSFSAEQASDLAIALNSGSMPVQLREDYTGVVGASLGADSIHKGIVASVVGVVTVVAFMFIYYQFGGLIANIALILNAFMILAALAYFKATLTLPGIAGLVLTMGMAVDSNVLIFERIREELRLGKSLVAAIESGYSRAMVTIWDANVTTLIAGGVLLQFGTGPIKGFAITLSIGVVSSVFTAAVVTKAIFDYLTARKRVAKLSMLTFVKPDIKFPFMANGRWAFLGSGAVIAIGIAAFALRGNGNFGVDFTEGTNMIVRLDTQELVDIGAVRASLAGGGFSSPIVQDYSAGGGTEKNRFVIRVGETTAGEKGSQQEPDATIHGRVQQALGSLTGGPDKVLFDEIQSVGPAVGKELRQDALRCVLYALVFIIIYLWFRFELKFAVAAELALVHDVLVTIGAFALTGRQISMGTIAAILTIIGYSLNDTIVVFDRVREDMKLYRGRGISFSEVLDLSINQTLSRTVLTSLTTLFTVVALYFFGGAAINDFAFALMVGIVVGTYSSIFVASPIALIWQNIQTKRMAHAGTGRPGRHRAERADKSEEAPV